MARKDALAVRIVKRQDGNSTSKCALARSREDVERKRHKRNPFDDSYVQLLQTPLEGVKVCQTSLYDLYLHQQVPLISQAGLHVIRFRADAGVYGSNF